MSVVENETTNETPTGENNVEENNTTVDTAQAAWNATAANCGFTVDNGVVYGAQKDALYVIPAPVNFDQVPNFLRNFVFFSIAKHAEYRVAQNAKGDINQAVAEFVDGLGDWKPVRDMDAFTSVWRNAVEQRIRGLIDHPDAFELPATKTYTVSAKEDGKTVLRVVDKGTPDAVLLNDTINRTADGVAKETLRPSVIEAAKERGKARGEVSEAAAPKARSGKASKADMGADLL